MDELDLSLDPVIARLKAEVEAFQERVGGAADIAAAMRDLKREPAAFLVPLQESPRPNTLETGGQSQLVLQRFGVLMAVANMRDARAESAQSELAPIRKAVFKALIAWQPDAERDPCTFAGGRIVRLSDRVLWWQDSFETAYYLRTP